MKAASVSGAWRRRTLLSALALLSFVIPAGTAAANEAQYDSSVRADNAWGYWRLNDSSTTAADASGNGRNFMYSAFDMSKLHIGSSGRWNQGVRFTGLGSITNPGSGTNPPALQPPITGTYSAEVWMRLGSGQSPSANVQLFYVGEPWRMDSAARVLQGQLQVVSDTDWTGWRTVGPRLDDGYWHHIAYTRSQFSQVAVYIDGVQMTTAIASSWTHGGTVLAFGNYTGASNGIDLTIDGAAFYTSGLSAARVAAHYNHDGAPPALTVSGPLFDRRNQTSDHRDEGLYNASYDLQISATDGTTLDPDSGVERLEVFVDGQSKFVKTQTCLLGGCSLSGTYTFPSDGFTDGDHNVDVVARDRSGKQTPAHFSVTVDRRGDIFAAQQLTASPSSGGEVIASEWARFGTNLARRLTPDAIQTRSSVSCSYGSCGEVRTRTRDSAIDGSRESFSVYRGTSDGDPRLDVVADLLEPVRYQSGGLAPVETGPLRSVLETWQYAPPARGAQYELYELEREEETAPSSGGSSGDEADGAETHVITMRMWVDGTTKMPIKLEERVDDGTSTTTYWSYDKGRLLTTEVPADHFQVAEPSDPEMTNSVVFTDDSSVGAQQDRETGATFQPYFLGSQFTISSGTYCMGSADLFKQSENGSSTIPSDPEAAGGNLAIITSVEAYYDRIATAGSCVTGQGAIESPDLEVISYGKSSSMAAAYREAIAETAQMLMLDPTSDSLRTGLTPVLLSGATPAVAYVLPVDANTTTALIETSNTTVVITGPFTKADVQTLAGSLTER